jgi:hypothetical protein
MRITFQDFVDTPAVNDFLNKPNNNPNVVREIVNIETITSPIRLDTIRVWLKYYEPEKERGGK